MTSFQDTPTPGTSDPAEHQQDQHQPTAGVTNDPTNDPTNSPTNDLDTATIARVTELTHESLRHVLGTLGRPQEHEIAHALYDVLLPYTDPDYYPGSRDRYSTLALLDGRVMVVLDHQAWAYQVFVVTSPACLLPDQSRPMLDEPDLPPDAVDLTP